MDQLRPFVADKASSAFEISCELESPALEAKQPFLQLRYHIRGPIEGLILAAPVAEPTFRDELWKSSCLELFLQDKAGPAYEEWNFSPAGHWAYYAFDAYRQPAVNPQSRQLLRPILVKYAAQHLQLEVAIPLKAWHTDHRYGLSAVLELGSGEKQYWALTHAGERPDFHRAESFVGRAQESKSRLT